MPKHTKPNPQHIYGQIRICSSLITVSNSFKQKQKYRGMFETQKSRNKTSSGDIGLNIKTICKSQSGTGPGVRRSKRPLLAFRTRCKCSMETSRNKVKSQIRLSGQDQYYGQKLV